MTQKEAAQVERIIDQLIDAVKNGTSHPEPYGLELNRKGLDAIAAGSKFKKAVLAVAALKRAG